VKPLRWYLRVLACLTVVSFLRQMGLPTRLGVDSAWGVAPGWQREIAFWNLAMYIVIAGVMRSDDTVCGRAVAIALVTLQLLVATNHAEATIASHAMLNVITPRARYHFTVSLGLSRRASARAASAASILPARA
jgi:KinB signaling pathway activation protein